MQTTSLTSFWKPQNYMQEVTQLYIVCHMYLTVFPFVFNFLFEEEWYMLLKMYSYIYNQFTAHNTLGYYIYMYREDILNMIIFFY